MLKKIALALVILVAGLGVFVAAQPADFRVERSALIAAPAEVVYPRIADFRAWTAWSPYEKLDAALERDYQGRGVGSVYHWVGKKAGEGRMTLAAAEPNARLGITADFIKPMRTTNQVEFTFQPAPEGTRVTWAMSGRKNFITKAFCLVVDMDALVGGDFEKGLAELKRLSEAHAPSGAAEAVAAAR
ncbi:MAG TPA: SRPBCC family protein [Longimicrobium sp.]|nr:SRPBCC family protein [Longimicrobium sp.]